MHSKQSQVQRFPRMGKKTQEKKKEIKWGFLPQLDHMRASENKEGTQNQFLAH